MQREIHCGEDRSLLLILLDNTVLICKSLIIVSMETLLLQAAAELNIRSEVESTLTSILQDVEHAHALEQSLRAHNELQQCKQQLDALKVRYEDREAAWEYDRREKERLGMLLLEEIVKLSAREVEGEKSKREIELRLKQLENEKSSWVAGKPQQQTQSAHDVTGVVKKGNEENVQHTDSTNNILTSKSGDVGGSAISEQTENNNETKTAEGDNVPPATNSTTKVGEDEELVDKFVPHKLDEETLMIIFAYLDPMDVINFSQTNKALLSKVNIMFGMGSDDGGSDVDQQQTQQQQIGGGDGGGGAVQADSIQAKPAATVSVTEASTNNKTTPAKASPNMSPKTSPKLFGMAGPSHKRQGSSTSVATTGTTGSAGTANPFSQVSSWFGTSTGSTDAPSVASAPSAESTTAPSAAAAADSGSEIKLNAAMANSMASKLTPAELSIILRMREKLQKCEADANKWRLEKEDAVANLASVEAVKEFLVTRVRDTERAVQTQKEEMIAVQKKSLEDQEVIVYMDEKVKELEKTVKDMKAREAETKQDSIDIVKKNEKKARVLSDMLRFEREQMAANEKEWKTAKKVLIKEVKTCRARIVALEAEVEGTRKQNTQLKQGLISLQGQSSPGGKKRYG